MDRQESEFAAASRQAFVEQGEFFDDVADNSAESIAVLARFPNVRSKASDTREQPPVATHRVLSPTLSFSLLAGTTVLLLIAAVATNVIGRKTASPDLSVVAQRPAWEPQVPAPLADTAPGWVAPTAPSLCGVAIANNSTPLAGDAPIANHAVNLGSDVRNIQSNNKSFAENMAQTRAELAGSFATGEAQPSPPISAAEPLTWNGFCRQCEQKKASSLLASPNAYTPPVSVTPGVHWADDPAPTYRTTNTPDSITIGPPITASSGREPSGGFYRK